MDGVASSSNPPAAAAGAALLAPGFRFHPTDEELVIYYLKRKITGRTLRVDAIGEVDLYRSEPWELPAASRLQSRDAEWYFFSPLDRKYANRSRTNRSTPAGYWKTTGKDRPVRRGPRTVGMKKTLVYHSGRAPRGERTKWVMHEYRLEDEELAGTGISQNGYVVCRIFQKNGPGPQNGDHDALFVEEEWEEDGILVPAVQGGDNEYVQSADFAQDQDQGNQPESTGLLVENSDGQNSISHLEDPFFVSEIFQDQGFVGLDPTPSDVLEGNTGLGPSHAAPTQNGEFLEMNDLINSAAVDYPSDHLLDERNDLQQQVYDIEEFFDTDETTNLTNLHFSPTDVDDLYLESDYLLNPSDGGYLSDQLAEDTVTFYDAPYNGLTPTQESTIHASDPLNLVPTVDSAEFNLVDEIMAYFDDTDNNLHYSTLDSSSMLQHADSSSSNQPNLAPEDDGGSARLIEAKQSSLNDEASDGQDSEMKNRTISNRLVSMLGSISAPPALAAELPGSPSKLYSQTSPSGSIHVTAGMIRIRGFELVGGAEHKDGDLSFLLSCGMAGDDDAADCKLGAKTMGWAMSVVVMLRGGFYFFFLWALFIAMCCKIGMRVYCR